MDTLLNRIVKEHGKLIESGREPDSLYMNSATLNDLSIQAESEFHVKRDVTRNEFLGMSVYVSEQYRKDQFRIYCKPLNNSEF